MKEEVTSRAKDSCARPVLSNMFVIGK